MKKKIIAMCTIVMIMVMVFAPMVVHAESITYDGRCTNYFTAEKTLSKINDTKLINWTGHICQANWVDCSMFGATCTSKILIAGTVRSTRTQMQPSNQHTYSDPSKLYKGTCQVQIFRDSSISRVHVAGDFIINP